MKEHIKTILLAAARKAHKAGDLASGEFPDIEVEEPKAEAHGDLATNFAMLSAKLQKTAPCKIAEIICSHIVDPQGIIERTEIAGPGFINFFITPDAWSPVVRSVLAADRSYGASTLGAGRKVQVEFVSANPTGPLHVGHGRGAAVGDSVARILSFCGYDVQKEYYINDSGRQINTLGQSVFLRAKELLGESVDFPDTCYQGDYIQTLARDVLESRGKNFFTDNDEQAVSHCARYAADTILAGIRDDLEAFGVSYNQWFSEQSLYDSGRVDDILEAYKKKGTIYEKDGAWWFRTSDYGDEKDRVVIRQNGQTTYFASDIAYHDEKFERGFKKIIDVWGADHHGYIPRMSAAIQAGGRSKDQFDVLLIQLVNLLRGGQPVAMSTRAGEFVTLRDVVDEVGSDAARFIFLTRDYASPLDFDLELAKQKSNDNPVYYVQYVHARIASILRKAAEEGIGRPAWDDRVGALLTEPEEIQLIKSLARYPEVVQAAALALAPHRITFFLMQLASSFHTYYNKHRVLTGDRDLALARLCLVKAVQKVIRNGLALLGVSAPDSM